MYYIYLTTNKINGKQYIGQHKGEPDDSYLGSGLGIMRAIKKYGKENFSKTVLCYCDTREEADQQERYYIELYDAVNSSKFYNAMEGGTGGDGWRAAKRWDETHPEEAQKRFEESGKKLRKWVEEHPEEAALNTQKMLDAAHEWARNNPDKVQEHMKEVQKALERWRQEYPEEYQEQINKWRESGTIANSKKILCVTTGIAYDSISEAARQTGTYQSNISKCLLGERKSAGKDKSTGKKLVWKYCDEEE